MLRGVLVLVCATACGRLGFGDSNPDAVGASSDTRADSTVTLIVDFGEDSTNTHTGVTTDTYLSTTQPTFNFGRSEYISAYVVGSSQAVGLLRFDLSVLPLSTTVVWARLHLRGGDGNGGSSMVVHALIEPWTEGATSGGAGVANWQDRISGTNWTDPGAGPGSRGAAPIGMFSFTQGPNIVDLDPPTVQGWVTVPSANHGLAITGPSGGGTFVSSNNLGTSGLRPRLELGLAP